MKKRRFSKGMLLGLLVLMTAFQLSTGQVVTKEFHEEYDAGRDTRLSLDNKYGNIDIRDWDQDRISIDVLVKVAHSSQERAERLLELIDVSFSTSGNEIRVITMIDEKFSRTNWGNDKEFEINYTVQMPRDVDLDLNNKYGSVFISELSGEAAIYVKYGKLTVNRLSRGNEKPLQYVDLGYSSGSTIAECDWLKADLKYSKLSIEKATAVVAFSKYSKLDIENASSLVIEGKYDKYNFGTLSNLVINTSYSGIEVRELHEKLGLVSAYTNVEIGHMPASFESVDIESQYGTVRVGIDENASYRLDGEAGYSKIYYHETGRISRIQENNSMKVSGTVGTGTEPKAVVKVVTRYGNIRLDH